jgi:ribosomal protein L23
MVKVFFPSMYMKLISVKLNGVAKFATTAQALLHVPPSMTKWEVREYLTKIYEVEVTDVATANFSLML